MGFALDVPSADAKNHSGKEIPQIVVIASATYRIAYLIGFDLEALTIHGYCTGPICCAGKVAYGTQWTVKRVHL